MGVFDFFSRKGKNSNENPDESKHYQTFFAQGKIELESRDFAKAVEYFDKAIADAEASKKGSVENAMVYKARALDGLGKFEDSEKIYDRAFELKPDDAWIWMMRGISYAEQGKTEKALKYYEKSFMLNPKVEDSMLAKASLHAKLNQQEKEVESLLQILRANPESKKARERLLRIQEDAKRQKNSQWLGGITKGIKLREGDELSDIIKGNDSR